MPDAKKPADLTATPKSAQPHPNSPATPPAPDRPGGQPGQPGTDPGTPAVSPAKPQNNADPSVTELAKQQQPGQPPPARGTGPQPR